MTISTSTPRLHLAIISLVLLGCSKSNELDSSIGKVEQPTENEIRFDFESGGLAGWSVEGEAFANQPVRGDAVANRRPDMTSNHVGDYWIGGYEAGGDKPQGVLISHSFSVNKPWASFLVGGGASQFTRVEIVDESSGTIVFAASGANTERMHREIADLSQHVGHRIFLRLIDHDSGDWGHLNFDDFQLHSEKPSFR